MTKRLQALDGLRAISILLVLACHMLPLGPKALNLNEAAGEMGMAIFFALSGFLITSSLLSDQHILRFFVRRLTRILPLAYLYLAALYLIIAPAPEQFSTNLFFIENYATQYLWQGHFWSLCVEIHFYFLIGLAVAIFGRRAIWLVIPAWFAVTAMRIGVGHTVDIRTHLRVDEILSGAVVAILYRNDRLKFVSNPEMVLAAAGLLFLCSWSPMGPFGYARPYVSAVMLCFCICLEDGWLQSILVARPMRYIAEISYALYIIHPATIYGRMNEGGTLERYLLKRPVSFALTFALAHVSTFHFEKVWIEWGRRISADHATPGSATIAFAGQGRWLNWLPAMRRRAPELVHPGAAE